MPLTNRSLPSFRDLRPGWLEVVDVASFENANHGPSFTSNENYHTTLDVLLLGAGFAFVGSHEPVVRLCALCL